MIIASFSGFTAVMPWGATLRLNWAPSASDANVLGSGANNIVYSEPILCTEAHQIGILIFPAGDRVVGGSHNYTISAPVVARIQWSADRVHFVEEMLEQPGPIAGGVQQFGAVIKEWGPNTRAWPIWRPVAANYFRLGVYTSGTPDTNDRVTAFVLLQRADQLQSSAS